jgi:hypothetical protein
MGINTAEICTASNACGVNASSQYAIVYRGIFDER